MIEQEEHNIDSQLCFNFAYQQIKNLFDYDEYNINGYDPIAAIYNLFHESADVLRENGWSIADLVDEINTCHVDAMVEAMDSSMVEEHRQCAIAPSRTIH